MSAAFWFVAGSMFGANFGVAIMAICYAGSPDNGQPPLFSAQRASDASVAGFGAIIVTVNMIGWPWLAGWI